MSFSPVLRRLGEIVRNLAIMSQVACRNLVDDPVFFAVQVSRRLPYKLSLPVARLLTVVPGAGTRALGHWLLGEKEIYEPARILLQGAGRGIQKRIAAEVAVNLGLLTSADTGLPLLTRARGAWNTGSITTAVELAEEATCYRTVGAKNYARRLLGEASILSAEYSLDITPRTKKDRAYSEEPKRGQSIHALHLLTNSLPATQSGYTLRSHRILSELINRTVEISAFTRTGYPVTIGCLTATSTVKQQKVTYRRVLPPRLAPTHPGRLQQWALVVLNQLHANPPQLIHTTTNYPNALVAKALANHWQIPWIYEARGVMEETWLSKQRRAGAEQSERFQLIRKQETRLMHQADHVITLSETMKQLFVARGVAEDKITVVPNAVDKKLFSLNLTAVQARARLKLPEQGFWVGSVSSLVDYEGFDTLLEAVAQLRRGGRDVRVLLAGNGVARQRLQAFACELAKQRGVGEFAVFLGRVPAEQAYTVHQALDLFAVPRRADRVCRSVTPLKPIEAMALGRAVVMSDIAPLAELVHSADSPPGLLCQPQNPRSLARAIDRLRSDSELRDRCAGAGREFAHTRTWEHSADIVEKLYLSLVKENPGGGVTAG